MCHAVAERVDCDMVRVIAGPETAPATTAAPISNGAYLAKTQARFPPVSVLPQRCGEWLKWGQAV